ncbi:CYTH and CHAD domain-containing protein [Hoyosella altamirensis]|uniref:CHAD domain-containing protein n=1 Tax=Hoyosella altamirensis TaxID=616997 RepID=A0A839RQ68_9ACTN|nr:CYTH and CHAD domain-containing protein [Hoyosella altamirensis]MBB3038945.1 CHAD domain-containing protein [Hoyosella altamirensis]
MVTQSRERELKFEAGQHSEIPELGDIPGVDAVADPARNTLHATYFDTEDLALIRARITLRHRTGGGDEGWHVKLPPVKGARTELHLPLTSLTEGPPSELLDLVRVHIRDKDVSPVAEIINKRRTCYLRDASGTVLAEVTDDNVTARSLRKGHEHTSRWREWEAELASGDEALLQRIRKQLLAAGARDSLSPSKLAKALGPLPQDSGAERGTDYPAGTAGGMTLTSLRKHRAAFVAYDPRVRADEHDSIHQMRVAARRIRSILRAYRRIFNRSVIDQIESELKWIARVLGAARDAEVMEDRLRTLIDEQPAGSIPAEVRDKLISSQQTAYRDAYDDVTDALDGGRYFRLLDSLDALLSPGTFGDGALDSADDAVGRAIQGIYRKAKKTEKASRAEADPDARDHLLHTLRKECKRIRYAAELASREHNSKKVKKSVKRVRKAAEMLQETLGEHQDGVITRALLTEAAHAAQKAGADPAAYELLAQHEQELADAAMERYREQWQALRHELKRLG